MAGSVANARKANTSGATSTTTSSFTSTAGSTIWVGVSDASGQGSLTISDNKGNTYTQIGTTGTSGSGAQIRRYYCANIAGGAGHTVTATWGSASDATVHVMELAGVASAPLDATASAQIDDNNPPWTVTSGTLAQADSIAIALTGTAFSGTWSESSGFTVQTQEGNSGLYWTGCAASRVVNATTALTPSFTISGGGSDCAISVDVFKAAAAGGGVTCTLAVTDASDTVASTAAVAIAATLARTDASDTLSAATTEPVTIAHGVTDAADSLSSAAGVAIVATHGVTDAADTLAADAVVGVAPVTVDLAATDEADTLASAAVLPVGATLAATDAADTVASAAGAVVAAFAGVTDAADTVASTAVIGTPLVTVDLAVTDAADTVSAAVAALISAALTAADEADTVASASVVQLLANLSVTDAGDTLASVMLTVPNDDEQYPLAGMTQGYPLSGQAQAYPLAGQTQTYPLG